VPTSSRTTSKSSIGASAAIADITFSLGRVLDRNPREAALIQSFVERKLKGTKLPNGEAEQIAFVAKTFHAVYPEVMKSRECRKAARKLLQEYQGLPGNATTSGAGSNNKPKGWFIWFIVAAVAVVLAACTSTKSSSGEKTQTNAGGNIMQPGTSQNDPANNPPSDAGSDAGRDE
jgi:hypothetical protein